MLRAKFKVDEIKRSLRMRVGAGVSESMEMRSVLLSPVHGRAGDLNDGNTNFWCPSSNGTMELTYFVPGAVELLELGKDYYVDFTPVTQPGGSAPGQPIEVNHATDAGQES
jgi:hypothetical protein